MPHLLGKFSEKLGPGGSSGKTEEKKIRPQAVLDWTKCTKIYAMLRDEKRYGTLVTAKDWSITFSGEKKMGTSFTNPVPYQNLMPTAAGDIDLDWFMDLTIGAGPLPKGS
ncbi:MAG: hypothetical protein HY748_04000 [Elusimicrobia bacterium]|nr:hypothetical protein [Elusimicrobiota bacterium]